MNDDLISRQAAIELIMENDPWWCEGMTRTIFDGINRLPSVDALPVKRGKWITEECLPGVAVCSICGHEIRGIGCQYTKYCDECGARMDE